MPTTSLQWKDDVRAALNRIRHLDDTARRIQDLATGWIGRRYLADPLIGGPHRRERLVVNLRSFDCVTLIESALALARSRSPAGFLQELKALRYRQGRVAWESRLHYFSDWLRSNHARGAIRIRTRGAGSRPITSRLALLENLPPRRTGFHVVPKQKIHLARRRIENAAIVAFASVRSRLDFFHTGLLFCQDQDLVLCHASRSAGRVLAEPLDGFLGRNRMRGIAFATPRDPGDSR